MEMQNRITVYLKCPVCGREVQRTINAFYFEGKYGRRGFGMAYLRRGSWQCPNGCTLEPAKQEPLKVELTPVEKMVIDYMFESPDKSLTEIAALVGLPVEYLENTVIPSLNRNPDGYRGYIRNTKLSTVKDEEPGMIGLGALSG